MLFEFDYLKALYRKSNTGEPSVWYAQVNTPDSIVVYSGTIGKKINKWIFTTNNPEEDINRRIYDKRKIGYKYLNELKDNNTLPVEEELINYLNAYLKTDRTNANNLLLAMLAKVYDNNIFNKTSSYLGQFKINGVRCCCRAKVNHGDLFKPIRLEFQAKEGTIWNSLSDLENYLLNYLPSDLLNKMINDEYTLDGELYLPGHTINEINHFVKNPNCKENKLIQYWIFDLAIRDIPAFERQEILNSYLFKYAKVYTTKKEHLANTNRIVLLHNFEINDAEGALLHRDKFINLGFEGLILRKPYSTYQFGARNSAMIKYKKYTDGVFKIVDIYPENGNRKLIPLFKCKNDINDETFECHITYPINVQIECLKNREKYIGKDLFIEFGERSGVKSAPFHIKNVRFVDDIKI